MTSASAVRVVSRRTVKPPPRPRERIPLTSWDVAMLSAEYIQKGLLFEAAPFSSGEEGKKKPLVDHLADALAEALATYYPVAGRFATEQHRDGCSVSIDCDGQGVDVIHAVADGVAIADVIPPGDTNDVPRVVQSFFPLDGAVNYDAHELPLFAVQVTELRDGVFVGFGYNHALSDGTAFWDLVNFWAQIARGGVPKANPLFRRWSPDGGETPAQPVVLPYADAAELVERPSPSPPALRERMLHFSAESLASLKERARQELVEAGDASGAAGVTRFQALSSLLWRSITRARRRMAPDAHTVCRVAINNRARLRPPLPHDYFGNSIYAISTEPVRAQDLLLKDRSHGWAAAAVGRAVAAHTDADIRARVQAWTANPVVYTQRFFDPNGVMVGSSPRFDMYGCDFGWGKPLAARSGRANKFDGKTSLYPGREGGGSIDAEVVLSPEHMELLDQDQEFWAAQKGLIIDQTFSTTAHLFSS